MRKTFLITGLIVAVLLALLWASGGLADLEAWAIAGQKAVQDKLAGAVRALRGGQPGALLALLGVAFAYGFFHAVGPGHGKVLIGGYGVARRVRLVPLALLALVSSVVQATVAVVLVYAFVLAFGWTRDRVEGVADTVLMPLSQAAIAMIGLWLVWRGFRDLRRTHAVATTPVHSHSGHHTFEPHVHDSSCNHAHGPTLDDMGHVHSLRDAALLVAGIAMRPCSGALFLLIITWTIGIPVAGIAGVYAMGLGTALVTISVATLSVWAREGALASLSGSAVARAVPLLELGAGAAITVVALSMFANSI
jgi:nickel/cobalt exporter